MSDKQQLLNAELIEALLSVDSNQSFKASNGSNGSWERYKKMFLYEVASNFNLQETKMKYTIPFGIAPYVKNGLIKDIPN